MKKVTILLLMVFFITNLNAQWQRNGLNGKQCVSICSQNSKLYVLTFSDGVYESNDGGTTWTQHQIAASYGSPYKIISFGNCLFVITARGIYKSIDNGDNWTYAQMDNVYSISNNSQYLFLSIYGGGVFRSSDLGLTWQDKSNGLLSNDLIGVYANDSKIILGAAQGRLYISSDNGETWVLKNNGLPSTVNVTPLYADNQFIYTRANPLGLYRSTDAGENWAAVNGMTNDYSYLYKEGNSVVTGASNGATVRASNDNGITWRDWDFGFSMIFLNTYQIIESNNFLLVAAVDGIYKRPKTDLSLDTPVAPTAIDALPIARDSFTARWNPVPGATGYYIDIAVNSNFVNMVGVYNNRDVGNVTNITISFLSPNVTFFYRVRAYNGGGISPSSNTISVTTLDEVPSPPIVQGAINVTTTGFTARWIGSGAVTTTGFYLDVSTDNTFSSFVTGFNAKNVGNVTSYDMSNLSPNTLYYYRVRAYNSGGASVSNNSGTITVTTVSSAPVALSAASITSYSFTARWDPVGGVVGYYLDVSTDNTFSSFLPGFNGLDVGWNALTYALSGLSPNTTYFYRVRVYNSGGVSSSSNVITVKTGPTAPTTIAATAVTSSGFTACWNVINEATGYYLDVSTVSNFSSFLSGYQNKDVGNVLTNSVTGLNPNTPYYYRVRAYNEICGSENSNVQTVTTLVGIPAAPQVTSNSVITQTCFKVLWPAVAGAAKYYLDVATNQTFSNFVSGYENKDIGNVTSFLVYGLQPNTDYWYRVRANNTMGTSPSSTPVTLKTKLNSQWIQTSGPSKSIGGPANTAVRYFIKVDNTIYAAAYSSTGLYKTTDNGSTWVKVFDCSNDVVNLLSSGNNIYVSTNGSGVYVSEDKGLTWQQRNSGLTNLQVYSLSINGANLYASTYGEGVFLSLNNGNSWIPINSGLTQKNINTVLALGATVLAGSNSAGIFISTNFGVDWNQTTLTGKNIIILKAINNKIYAATWGSGVYVSNDNGATWNQSNTGLGANLNCLIFSIHTANDLFTATGDGIYYSKNAGATWTNINANFPAVTVWTVEAFGNYLFAGTSELGVFRRTLSEIITDIDVSSELPSEFKLYQNYPNPFNPSTTISYQLPTAEHVTLKVYDVLGNEVITLIDEYKQAGKYDVKFGTSHFERSREITSGIYFYRLSVGNFSSTRKLILIK